MKKLPKKPTDELCAICLSLENTEVPAIEKVVPLFDRNSEVWLCEYHYDEWCLEAETFLNQTEEDDY